MEPEWITADCASRFAAFVSSEALGRLAICHHANGGLIKAKAKLLIIEENGQRREMCDTVIPREFWWAEGNDALDQNWQTGDFATSVKKTARWQAFGVSFDLIGVIDLVPATERAKAMSAISIMGNPDWMNAITADRHLYVSGHYAPEASRRAIIDLCRSGHIAARALRMEMRKGELRGDPIEVAVEWDIPLWFWRDFTGTGSSEQQWDIGTFAGIGRHDQEIFYVKLSGVHFLRQSIPPSNCWRRSRRSRAKAVWRRRGECAR
jgi:hypothetical protein